ncbi:hypothetical protein RhiirC2_787621 [Rhizophagus irregularis]|uniref:F-box domain-containing protein n=1 Tax=Rhizophagus irregularis TaxID=588596 RepID=A0A2N1MRU1_9GLOM|nr:hypothetical protein RhiirC2_787621 [Rhizophagus irregularis]
MSCSKIFSGNFPELTYEIIKYFQNDFLTLHSCILVNRLWCRLATPLLWENPFSIHTENYNYIEIYLQYLNDDFKAKLKEYNIIINSLPSNTLFNYSSFLKYLNISKFISSVINWLEATNETSIYSDFIRLTSDICLSLLKIFIENEVNLNVLEIDFKYTSYKINLDDILELILQNTNFIHNIRNLNLYIVENKELKHRILSIIELHQNLKKILLDNSFFSYQSLLLSKDYNCSNTLSTIIFFYVDFEGIINLNRIFEQLNVLESVHIIYCSSLNTSFTQQIINLTKPFKLKSLFIENIEELSEIESLQLLIQKSCDYLENFGYNCGLIYPHELNTGIPQGIHQLLDLIMIHCKNIKFLDLDINDNWIIFPALNLIENIKHNLNYLSIDIYDNIKENNSFVIQRLGEIIPFKLEYLHLYLYYIEACDFEVFLKSSQDTFIKKLLINNFNFTEGQDILPSIKTYIMKKRRVKYLAINGAFFRSEFVSDELFLLKDEVKEFMLYDIKVQSYHDSIINLYDYMKEVN